jgi:hypothetical protein
VAGLPAALLARPDLLFYLGLYLSIILPMFLLVWSRLADPLADATLNNAPSSAASPAPNPKRGPQLGNSFALSDYRVFTMKTMMSITVAALTLTAAQTSYAKLGDYWNHVTRYSRHHWPGGGVSRGEDLGILWSEPKRAIRWHNLPNGVETTECYLGNRCVSVFYSFTHAHGSSRDPSPGEINDILRLNGMDFGSAVIDQGGWARNTRASDIYVTQRTMDCQRFVVFMSYPSKVSQFVVYTFEGWLEQNLYVTTWHSSADKYKLSE